MEYPKILNLYKRDGSTHRIGHEFTRPEFAELAGLQWVGTEKIDGMNMRVTYDPLTGSISIQGRTDKAQIPGPLMQHMQERFTLDTLGYVETVFNHPEREIILFGEGYGAGIQKPAGTNYCPMGQKFVLFDIWVNGTWASRAEVQAVAQMLLAVPAVPVLFQGTLFEAAEIVACGINSVMSVIPQRAEGLVLRPVHNLYFAHGERVQVKMKTRDYEVRGR